MYNFKLCLSFLNKFVVLLITISLLFVSFSFNFEKNIKQELSNLYEATSVCACYNTITNFSYVIINKILESTKIVLTEEELSFFVNLLTERTGIVPRASHIEGIRNFLENYTQHSTQFRNI